MLTSLSQYIPLQNGQSLFVKDQNLINNLLGVVGYELRDGYAVFTEDLTVGVTSPQIPAVDVQLVVMDLNHYSEYDILPMTADMAAEVVAEVVSLLMPTPMPDGRVDPKSEEALNKR